MKIHILLYFLNLVLLLFPVNSDDDDDHENNHVNETEHEDEDIRLPNLLAKFSSIVAILGNDDFICPGILIGPKHVIASAQCFIDVDDKDNAPEISDNYSITIGCGDTENNNFQTRKVSTICVHKKYRSRIKIKEGELWEPVKFRITVNDIAILELHSPVTSNSRCSPTEILTNRVSAGTKCNLATWVYREHKVTFTHDALKKKNVLKCTKYIFILPKMHACLLTDYNKNKFYDYCPLYCEGKLEGIVSHHKTVSNITSIVLTRTSNYYKWIEYFKKHGNRKYCLSAAQRKHFNKNYQSVLPFLVLTLHYFSMFNS